MASIVFPLGWRLTDSNGKPVNNGKIYVYDAGTSNESSVYSDKALSTALTQPIRTNSGGIPITSGDAETLIYVATGADYKVEAKTSADAQIWGPIDDYPILGRNSGTIAVADGGTGSTTASGARTALGAAAASDVTSMSSTLTTISGERTALPGGSFNDLAGLDVLTSAYLSGIKEVCLNVHYDESPLATSLTTTIPADGTVPQISEGTEIFSNSFTPQNASSTLEIECFINVDTGTADRYPAVAIFQSGSTAALNVATSFPESASARRTSVYVRARFAPGSTSAVTISARAGNSIGTATLNNLYGGGEKTWFKIRELLDT